MTVRVPWPPQDISAAPSSESPTGIPAAKRRRGSEETPGYHSVSGGGGRSSGQAETRSGDAPRTGGVISRVFSWCKALCAPPAYIQIHIAAWCDSVRPGCTFIF